MESASTSRGKSPSNSERKAVGIKPLIIEALRLRGGKARIPEIGKHIWERYRADLERAGDFFYVWQYEMRWAGNQLVNEGKLIKNRDGWELTR